MILALVARFVTALLSVLELAMIVRAVISWFPSLDDTRFADFVYMITDPMVVPFQILFQKMGWFQNLPVDMSFMAAYLALVLVQSIVSALL